MTRLEVTGNPRPEELAAVVAVLAARPAAVPAEEAGVPSRWASREALMRRPLHPGPGSWGPVAWHTTA